MRHPGLILNDMRQKENWKYWQLAQALGISIQQMSLILNGKQPISVKHAVAIEKAGFGTAEGWAHRQVDYDLFVLQKPNA